jgi:hypothetical protein
MKRSYWPLDLGLFSWVVLVLGSLSDTLWLMASAVALLMIAIIWEAMQ